MPQSAAAELDLFRQCVNCAAVLEHMAGGWKLDVRESTRRALKYRRGAGEIIIVNHDGRGWWDATGSAKGDVFNLVQHLDPSLNFGAVRKVLRGFVGMAPTDPAAERRLNSAPDKPERSPDERWAERPSLRRGDPAWIYLAEDRAIPENVLNAAAKQDCVRLGAYRSAWFAHRRDGVVTQVEIRSRTYKGSLRGGSKTLFQFDDANDAARRVAVLEAPIDALSLAAIERVRADTLYVATGGGMGPATLEGRGSKQGNSRNAESLCWRGFVDFRCDPERALFEPRQGSPSTDGAQPRHRRGDPDSRQQEGCVPCGYGTDAGGVNPLFAAGPLH
jgi:hypothetical protein